MKKYTKKDIEDMKEEIFENLCGAYIDDGLHPNDAEELAKEELDELTDTAIVKMFLEMNSYWEEKSEKGI